MAPAATARPLVSSETSGTVASHCPYCALQCAQELAPTPDARLPISVAGRDFPTNRGGLCQKGWTSAEVLRAPDRLRTPLVRGVDGELAEASWDEAIQLIADRVTAIQAARGKDAVAVFGGGGLTNEKAYTLGKFARLALGTRYVDYNGRFCMSSAAAASNRSLGMDRGLGFPLEDVGGASAVLLVGSNVAATMPPFVQHLAGARSQGGLIVVDPRQSETAALTAGGAGVHLQCVPGTDLVVLLAILHVVLAEGKHDRDYLDERAEGFDKVRRTVAEWWPERAEAVCGVPADSLRMAARILADAAPVGGGDGAYVLTGRGLEQSTHGVDGVSAAINLALSLGLIGRVGSGFGPITGQGNGQGGREHGQKSDQLPGYRSISDPDARAHVARVWGVDPDVIPGPGVPAVELLDKLGRDDGPSALFVHGSNLVVSAPNSDHVRARLEALDLLVVCDVVPSETALLADVVLPVTQWAEEEGTMTNLEGRIIRRRKVADAPDQARSELDIWRDLAMALGSRVWFETYPPAVFDEMARASAGGVADYSGIDYDRLDAGEEIFWPCPQLTSKKPHPGTPRVFLKGFPTASGKARMFAVDHSPPRDDLRPDAPVYLITGRVLHHYQSGAQTRRVDELNVASPESFVEFHPLLADQYQLAEGDMATLTSSRGTATARVRISDRTRPDTVFMAFHWSGAGNANRLTNDATDAVSGMPEFKVCAVSVARAQGGGPS